MKNSKFFILMCLFAMVLTGTVVLSTSCQRKPQHLRVEVSPEMGELVEAIQYTMPTGQVYTVLQFNNGFAQYKGKIPADSCLVREFIGVTPAGAFFKNIAAEVDNNWIPVQLFHFSDSDIATAEIRIGEDKFHVQATFEPLEVVELENIQGSVLLSI